MSEEPIKPYSPIPFDLADEFWDKARHGMYGMRVKHRVVLFRHGESIANVQFVANGTKEDVACEGEPHLTARGRQQGKDIAQWLSTLEGEPTRIEVSPLKRAWETAAPTIEMYEKRVPVKMHSDLRELWHHAPRTLSTPTHLPTDDAMLKEPTWRRDPETDEAFAMRVSNLLERWKKMGTVDQREQTVVFTHSLLISQLVRGLNTTMYFHLVNGSATIIDFTEDDCMHVHCVNRTSHLSTPTGHHTAMV